MEGSQDDLHECCCVVSCDVLGPACELGSFLSSSRVGSGSRSHTRRRCVFWRCDLAASCYNRSRPGCWKPSVFPCRKTQQRNGSSHSNACSCGSNHSTTSQRNRFGIPSRRNAASGNSSHLSTRLGCSGIIGSSSRDGSSSKSTPQRLRPSGLTRFSRTCRAVCSSSRFEPCDLRASSFCRSSNLNWLSRHNWQCTRSYCTSNSAKPRRTHASSSNTSRSERQCVSLWPSDSWIPTCPSSNNAERRAVRSSSISNTIATSSRSTIACGIASSWQRQLGFAARYRESRSRFARRFRSLCANNSKHRNSTDSIHRWIAASRICSIRLESIVFRRSPKWLFGSSNAATSGSRLRIFATIRVRHSDVASRRFNSQLTHAEQSAALQRRRRHELRIWSPLAQHAPLRTESLAAKHDRCRSSGNR